MGNTIEDMLLLLLSIKNKGSTSFVGEHISFGTVGYLCAEAVKQGYIIEERDDLYLSEKGLLFIEEANKKFNKSGIDKEISTIPSAYIKKISQDDVYLPEKI
jgi:hypothetical protein